MLLKKKKLSQLSEQQLSPVIQFTWFRVLTNLIWLEENILRDWSNKNLFLILTEEHTRSSAPDIRQWNSEGVIWNTQLIFFNRETKSKHFCWQLSIPTASRSSPLLPQTRNYNCIWQNRLFFIYLISGDLRLSLHQISRDYGLAALRLWSSSRWLSTSLLESWIIHEETVSDQWKLSYREDDSIDDSRHKTHENRSLHLP